MVLLLFVCFSCDNNIETTNETVGTYSAAEKEEFTKLAEQYGAEVVFIGDKPGKKVSIEELERVLIALKDLKAEGPLRYAIFYKTPTGLTIPRSRSYQSDEFHPVSPFYITIAEGESFSFFGEVNICFNSTGNDKLMKVSGHAAFHKGVSHSAKGYTYTVDIRDESIEKIEPSQFTKIEDVSEIKFITEIHVKIELNGEILINEPKKFVTTIPIHALSGTEVNCSIRDIFETI